MVIAVLTNIHSMDLNSTCLCSSNYESYFTDCRSLYIPKLLYSSAVPSG